MVQSTLGKDDIFATNWYQYDVCMYVCMYVHTWGIETPNKDPTESTDAKWNYPRVTISGYKSKLHQVRLLVIMTSSDTNIDILLICSFIN